jgi:hypothetical protein
MIVQTRQIIPWAHMFLPEGSDKPVFMHCTLEGCWICYKIEIAKLIFMLQALIEEKTAKDDLPQE